MSKKVREMLVLVEETMTPMKNFGGYRPLLVHVESSALIPCLGPLPSSSSPLLTLSLEVHLKDLLYHTEASADFKDEAKEVLNGGKLDQMGKIISVFAQAQQKRYNFLTEQTLAKILSVQEVRPPSLACPISSSPLLVPRGTPRKGH